ncbi:MAG: nuclear transport factor 2 family protein [Burkholderiales bacterium]|nr:nuclear transport factor 2 family protein [Burkholderiales bacterium]MDE2300310.1 nuclear transport factor 2 family protein [Burkholderiales bacterium]MDE2628932.1 nuclear transport factor 2 family protein [Burkholderiales bacterium]
MARPKASAPLASPDEIEQQFYQALQRGDIEHLMAVWSDDDEITCVHPGGPRVVGAAAIRAAFESIFANGAVNARPEKVRRLQTHACAVHSVLEHIEVMTAEGPQAAWVVATNVYLKTTQGWRLVAHHASPGSPREVQELFESASVLH